MPHAIPTVCRYQPLRLKPGAESSSSSAFTRGGGAPSSTSQRRVVIKNPTRKQLLESGPLEERTLGNPNAKVTVIEYGSWTCPHCRAFRERTWPAFKREYIDTGKIHYILREFPIGRSSGNAALVTRCAPKKDYFKLYDLYLTNQDKWVSQDVRTDKIYAIAAKTGMSRAAFDACLKNEALIKGVKWSKDRGRELRCDRHTDLCSLTRSRSARSRPSRRCAATSIQC